MCVLSAYALSGNIPLAAAETEGGPYHGIVERNVFNLKPPPPAVPPEPPPAPPPKIVLTGITTILDSKMALFKVAVPPRPPEPAKEESRILSENQRDGDIEVLQIDEMRLELGSKSCGTFLA